MMRTMIHRLLRLAVHRLGRIQRPPARERRRLVLPGRAAEGGFFDLALQPAYARVRERGRRG